MSSTIAAAPAVQPVNCCLGTMPIGDGWCCSVVHLIILQHRRQPNEGTALPAEVQH